MIHIFMYVWQETMQSELGNVYPTLHTWETSPLPGNQELEHLSDL